MKKVKICATVTGANLDQFIGNIKKTEELAEYIELRTDFIQNFTVEDVEKIRKVITKPAIFSCRDKKNQGGFKESEEKRVKIIKKAIELEFDYVDLEIDTIENNSIDLNTKTQKIISYYDFKETPKYWKLLPIINKIHKHQPNVFKIMTKINNENDVHTLFRLIVDKDNDDQWIIIGNGKQGKITRVLSPILGGYLTYASTDWTDKTLDQISISELKQIYDDLHLEY